MFHRDFRDHLIATYQLRDQSTAGRLNPWVDGVRIVKEKPFRGFGPGSFYNRYKPFTITSFKTWVSSNPERSTVHNYFLLVATEQGLFGLILLLVLLGVAIFVAERLYH